jgi:hypothetical protein
MVEMDENKLSLGKFFKLVVKEGFFLKKPCFLKGARA